MDVEMYKIMDKIMETMHQIATNLSETANAEMSGKKITKEQIDKNKIFETLFMKTQTLYRELEDKIFEKIDSYNKVYGIENDIVDEMSMSTEEEEANIISELSNYLAISYSNLRYVSTVDENGEELTASIYKNTKFESLRNYEYTLQCLNLNYLLTRDSIKSPIGEFSFNEKRFILVDMAEHKFYNNVVFEYIDKYISDLEEKFENNDIDEEEYKAIRDQLIEEKHILYFSYLNNKYNGILQENDIGKLATVKKYLENDAETILLGMTKFEIDKNINADLDEYKAGFREIVKDILLKESSRKKKTNKNSNTLNSENTIKGKMEEQDKVENKYEDER